MLSPCIEDAHTTLDFEDIFLNYTNLNGMLTFYNAQLDDHIPIKCMYINLRKRIGCHHSYENNAPNCLMVRVVAV
jgi:hypothetical protein